MVLLGTHTALAQVKNYPPAKVSFNDFKELVEAVEPHRAERVIDLDTFLKMSQEPGVIIFDSRYVNLYGYGYRNVYELDELVDVNDPRIAFEGSIVKKREEGSPPIG
jgi:hypothetical protein